jgi:serine/threonine-protein kinase
MFQMDVKLQWKRIVIVAVVAIIAFYFSFNKIMNIITHNKKEVIVPDIVNKNLNEALSELGDLNLAAIKIGEEFNVNMPPGVVSRQSPHGGMKVREGKAIRIYISKGGESIYVPDLTNMSIRNADIALKGANLTFGEVSNNFSVNVEKGNIMAQDPQPGTVANKWDIVNIVVSEGEPAAGIKLTPNFLKRKTSQAKEMAARRNINLEIKTAESAPNNVPIDTVVSQDPAPDANITNKNSVTIYIKAK